MVLDKKSPIFFDKAFKKLTIIISACPTLFFNFCNITIIIYEFSTYIVETFQKKPFCDVPRASAGRSSIRHWRKDLTNDERKCNSFRQFDESIKSTYFK